MVIKYKKKRLDIPPPVASPNECVLRVSKIGYIPLGQDGDEDKKAFPSAPKKLWFFFWHEGIKLTLNKIKAYRLQREVEAEKKLVFVHGYIKDTNRLAVAIGPQECPQAEYLSFPKELTLLSAEERDFEEDYKRALEYSAKNREKIVSLSNFSKFSGRKIEVSLANILEKTSPTLTSIDKPPLGIESEMIDHSCCVENKKMPKRAEGKFDLFLIGAGAYAWAYVLPYLKRVRFHTVVDLNPILAGLIGERYKFCFKDTSIDRALPRMADCDHPLLIVASYHSTHFPIVEKALSINPQAKIFLEKPPVTSEDQLVKLLELRHRPDSFIEIGYNRRHALLVRKAGEILANIDQPCTMTCVIKEKELPMTHWYYWPSQGTRVMGNLCHWVDLGVFFIKTKPVEIIALSASKKSAGDEVSCAIRFEDDSLLTLVASERGNPLRGVQEYIEIRSGDITISIDDFLRMKVQKGGRQKIYRRIIRDKGHARMYKELMANLTQKKGPVYPNSDLETSSRLYLSLSRLLLSGGNHMKL